VRARTGALTGLRDTASRSPVTDEHAEPRWLAEDLAMTGSSLVQALVKLAFLIVLLIVASKTRHHPQAAPARARR
jgi:hypothetical protein